MELMHGNIVIIGIMVLILLLPVMVFFSRKKNGRFYRGTKASNTHRIRQSKLYKSLNTRYLILTAVMITGLVGSVISSLFLIARPYMNNEVTSGVKKRDIILCLDVSYSLYDLNIEITEYLKQVVAGLEGDRFGINIFNASSVTYVPLTDDYDYVIEKLDDLNEYFVNQKEYMEVYEPLYELPDFPDDMRESCDELESKLLYFDNGTRFASERGSSLIGEGLATALYSLPYLEDSERTRVIIMCTDNELNSNGEDIVNLSDAAALCQKNKVTMFGIFPSEEIFYTPELYDYSECLGEFAAAAEKTGGKCYVRTADQSVSEIVEDIQKQEAMLVNVVQTRQTEDMPKVPFITLIICLAAFSLAGLVLQK
ncbi:MAG: hypothetical protein K6E70_07245 [Butyrivibrio sp.]|nr:hypothetical protein [Butyrivibrio sp.]